MTIHKDFRGTRDMIHMHAWSDGGGTYGAVIELMPHDTARVTLIGDTVETFEAERVTLSPDALTELVREYASTDDYANTDASDIAELADTRHARAYVIHSHGVTFAVSMF